MIMRGGRLQKLVLIPFSIRCDSESSVALAVSSSSSSAAAATATLSPKQSKTREKGGEEKLNMNKNQSSVPKASFTQGLNRLIRRFKTFSHFFVYKEEMDYVEKEMEIGFPTDVKHVTHIGSDGSTTINPVVSSWGNNLRATEILSFPSISLQQFEIAMAAQSHS